MNTDPTTPTAAKTQETIKAAEALNAQKDTANLLEEIARRDAAAKQDATLLDDPNVDGTYATQEMALGDNLREIGDRLVKVWVRRLHGVICGDGSSDEDRKKLADALNVSESAAIAAVTAALLPFVSPLLAAPAAVVIVRQFLIPAADELCEYWSEKLDQPIV